MTTINQTQYDYSICSCFCISIVENFTKYKNCGWKKEFENKKVIDHVTIIKIIAYKLFCGVILCGERP